MYTTSPDKETVWTTFRARKAGEDGLSAGELSEVRTKCGWANKFSGKHAGHSGSSYGFMLSYTSPIHPMNLGK